MIGMNQKIKYNLIYFKFKEQKRRSEAIGPGVFIAIYAAVFIRRLIRPLLLLLPLLLHGLLLHCCWDNRISAESRS